MLISDCLKSCQKMVQKYNLFTLLYFHIYCGLGHVITQSSCHFIDQKEISCPLVERWTESVLKKSVIIANIQLLLCFDRNETKNRIVFSSVQVVDSVLIFEFQTILKRLLQYKLYLLFNYLLQINIYRSTIRY
jgi:hypothetical protein